MKQTNMVVIALLSITLVALELSWTRIFSAEFYYTFAFLVLSLAVLGLGMGGLAVRLFPWLGSLRRLGAMLTFTGILTVVGPVLVFKLGLRFSELPTSWIMAGKLLLAIVILGSAFFFGGIALATLFRQFHREMPRLYMADLLGAGLGVVVAIWLMNLVGTPAAASLIALPVLLAATIAGPGWLRIVPIVLAVITVVQSGSAIDRLEVDRPQRGPVIYKHWDAMGKIKIYGFAPEYRGIEIDNVANSPVYGFDGNWDRPDSLKYEFGIDVSNLIRRFDSCTFLSLGAGGGVDCLQALQEGATEVHAVEVNPHINRMMLYGDPAGYIEPDSLPPDSVFTPIPLDEFSGHIYEDPRVIVATEDARAYVSRHPNKFDVIYSLSSNTFTAVASGSFAMAETYLFTVEAFRDYWNALSDDGFMMMEHQFYMPRLTSALIQALDELGIEHPTDHFAIYDLPKMRRKMILLSKRPLTEEIRTDAFGDPAPEAFNYAYPLYPAADSLQNNLIHQIVTAGWSTVADTAQVAVSPCTDDRPFVGQMGLWKNVKREAFERMWFLEVFGFPLSKLLIVTILAIVLILIVPLNLLPYLKRGPKLRAAPWFYFFLIGAAFMIVEVVLIQKHTLWVGPSAYAIATVLLSLFVASGIGARFARRVGTGTAFLGLLALLILEILAFRAISGAMTGLSLYPRMLVSAAFVLPLGFFMGMPFPKGVDRVRDLVDWGFAVNGAGAVLGSTAILLVAMSVGLNAALLVGGGLYLLALLLLGTTRGW